MGEIRIVGPGKTRGHPYLVCKRVLCITCAMTRIVGVSAVVCPDNGSLLKTSPLHGAALTLV